MNTDPSPPPSVLELLRSASLSQVVLQEMEAMILRGDFGPGDKLNEKLISDRLGVSRGPVREAFQALHARGLVEMIPNRGVFVQRVTRRRAVEIYDVRAALFGAACRLLGERIDAAALAELRSLLAQMDEVGRRRDLDEYYPLNLAFHARIVTGAGNETLAQTYTGLVGRLHLFRARGLVHGGGFESSNVEHRVIVDALAAGEPRAAFEAGYAHVQAGKARIVTTAADPEDR
jgi:DNA-binding GntR family transcriptional regulator